MKISRKQVAANRQLILEGATRLFLERGFERVTVADIMQLVDLTHGAFYSHFQSKDHLIAEACTRVLKPASDIDPRPPESLEEYASAHLDPAQLDNPGGECLFATLGSEAACRSPSVRQALTAAMKDQIASFSRTSPGTTADDRRQYAIGSWTAMIGALILARISDDPSLSRAMISETRKWLKL